MLFNSIHFILFFPILCLFYWIVPQVWKNICLLIISYWIYFNWNPALATLLLFGITISTFVVPIIVLRFPLSKKFYLSIGVLLSLWPLLFFKYYNFINRTVSDLLSSWGLSISFSSLDLLLPLGISFFTFQALGYMIDACSGKTSIEKNFIHYALFVAFFPQISSGPISKANELLPQIKTVRFFDENKVVEGLKLLLWGMFLKVCIADPAGVYVDSVYSNYDTLSGAICFLGSLFYSIQIYTDFSGYSLMAVGVAKILGFDIINNFKRPYFAVSVTDFWRRWHISLSRWLKDYVYIPLGGNRVSKVRNYFNILVTFFVSGLWHGANWTFIFWGLLHGLIQCIEKFLGLQSLEMNGIKKVRIFVTFFLINFIWVFFRMPTISDAFSFIAHIFLSWNKGEVLTINTMVWGVIGLLLIKEIRDEFFPKKFLVFNNSFRVVRWTGELAVLFLILLWGTFDAGQFIYVNF